MTPEQMLKHAAIQVAMEWEWYPSVKEITAENIDDVYDELVDADLHWDALSEIRGGEVETNIPSEMSRHYESKSVAMRMANGQWVGWTYWYGGGKHGEPEAIDWMEDAYFLDCKEEEKLVTVRTFTKQSEVQPTGE